MKQPDGSVRRRILDAAAALLRDRGPTALTQTRVATAAGVSQGHLTYYFPRKHDLMLAVARHAVVVMREELGDLFAGEGWTSADASVRDRARTLVAYLVKNRARTRMLLSLILQADTDPELRELIQRDLHDLRELTRAAMGRGVPDLAVDLYLATLWGLGLQHLMYGDDRDEAYTDALVARLLSYDVPKE